MEEGIIFFFSEFYHWLPKPIVLACCPTEPEKAVEMGALWSRIQDSRLLFTVGLNWLNLEEAYHLWNGDNTGSRSHGHGNNVAVDLIGRQCIPGFRDTLLMLPLALRTGWTFRLGSGNGKMGQPSSTSTNMRTNTLISLFWHTWSFISSLIRNNNNKTQTIHMATFQNERTNKVIKNKSHLMKL